MNKNRWLARGRALIDQEEGSVHLMLFGLFGLFFAALVWVTAFNWLMQTSSMSKTKPLLDHAAHAASLSIDPVEAARGRLVWNEADGTAAFYRNLEQNLKLDTNLRPGSGSHLREAPVVHLLEYVTAPAYPFVVHREVAVHEGTAVRTLRHVDVTIYGPSVVAVVEVSRPLLGLRRSEPIVLSSVASVRMR